MRPEDLCRDNPDLLPELLSLIKALAHVEGLMVPSPVEQTPLVPTSGTFPPGTLASRPHAPPGYEIHVELGRGGMGVVYKAKQLGLNRLVALKMLLAGVHASADDHRRFRREAEAVARLQHPNIVQVFQVGEHEGRAFLSLEYIDGGSLADHLRGRALPAAEAARLLHTLASAIESAHQAGIVHRDLKPGNVLLSFSREPAASAPAIRAKDSPERDPAHSTGALAPGSRLNEFVPKISDFGLAKRLDEEYSRTYQGALLGTPAYMSPEQARAEPGEVGRAVDVYALGAILYECLTGQVPFRAATLLDLLDLVQYAEPVPPRRLNRRIPRDLEVICLKCLQKNPARRYPRAADLAEDLARYLDGRPILARPVGPFNRAARWARRHKALAALVAVSCVAIAGFVVAGSWVSARFVEDRVEKEALASRVHAAEQVAEAEKFFGLLTEARELIGQPRPGWTWQALDNLNKAARLPGARTREVELRTAVASCLGAIDLKLVQTIDDTPRATSLAWHPTKRLVAVGNRGGGFALPAVVHVIDLDSPSKRRRLFLRFKSILGKDARLGSDIVHTLAFSPDGRHLVAGMRSGVLYVWDLTADSNKPTSAQIHSSAIVHIHFSRDGQSVYSVAGQVVKRTTLAKLESPATYAGKDLYRHLGVHPRDGWVAVCDQGKTQRLHPDTLLPQSPVLSSQGKHFAFGPDGRTLIQSEGRALRAWDADGDRLLQTLRAPDAEFAHEQAVSDLVLSPDGTLLLSACEDTRHVRLWDLISGRLVTDLPVGDGTVKLAFAPNGRSFAVTAEGRTLIYEVAGRREQAIVGRRPGVVQSFAMAESGALAVTAAGAHAEHGEVVNWPAASDGKPANPTAFAPFSDSQSYPLSYIGSNGRLAVLGIGGPSLTLADPGGTPPPTRFPVPGECRGLARSPSGRLWGAVGEEICSWDPAGKVIARWQNSLGLTFKGISAMRHVSAGRRWVVAAGQDGAVRVLPAGTGNLKQAGALQLTNVSLSAGTLSPDESLAVVGAITGRLWIVRVPSAELVGELPALPDRVTAVTWREGLVACGCQDGTVTLFRHDGADFTKLLVLRHGRPVRDVQMAPDRDSLAVLLAGDRGVRVWDLASLRKRLEAMNLGF